MAYAQKLSLTEMKGRSYLLSAAKMIEYKK